MSLLETKNLSAFYSGSIALSEVDFLVNEGSVIALILEKLKNNGVKDSKIEGKESGEWKLVDGIDLIIHIFHPEKRKFYELEKIWSELIPKEKVII